MKLYEEGCCVGWTVDEGMCGWMKGMVHNDAKQDVNCPRTASSQDVC